jgi:N-glycosylase/DNA lyase
MAGINSVKYDEGISSVIGPLDDEREEFAREIKSLYHEIRALVEERCSSFRDIWRRGDEEEILCELLFCLLTPAARARSAWQALCCLREKGLIFQHPPKPSSRRQRLQCISGELNTVRFRNNKARNVMEAEQRFYAGGRPAIRSQLIGFSSVFDMREWLVETVRGMGYKEGSHFLRNIGLFEDIAILDRHVLRHLNRFGVIDRVPESLSRRQYLATEDVMRSLAHYLDIPLHHLDMVLWYRGTGELFK